MAYLRPFSTAMGQFPPGLVGTLGYQLIKPDGTVELARATANVVETTVAGVSLYQVTVSIPSSDWEGQFIWDDTTTAANQDVSPVKAIATGVLPAALPKNKPFNGFSFTMIDSTTKLPVPGKTVTAQRSLDGGAFAACANAPSGIASGGYAINLAATDLNANNVLFLFTAPGCDPFMPTLFTQP